MPVREVIDNTYKRYNNLKFKRISVEQNDYKRLADEIHNSRNFKVSNLTDVGKRFYQLCKNVLFLGRTELVSANGFDRLQDRTNALFANLTNYELDKLDGLKKCLNEIYKIEVHPFLDEVRRIKNKFRTVCIVHNKESHNKKTTSILADHDIKVDLRSHRPYDYSKIYDAIVLCGKPEWYDGLTAFPPTEQLFFLMYDWDFTNFKITQVFSDVPSLKGEKPTIVDDRNGIEGSVEFDSSIDETIDRDIIKSRLNELDEYDRKEGKISVSILTLLDDQYAVFVPSTSDYKFTVLAKENSHYDLIQIQTKNSRSDMWYLDRGFSSDEIKKKLSEKKYGEEYKSSVEHQKRWKKLLFEKINRWGINSVVSELKDRGAINARRYNVTNWASFDIIRPNEDKDLESILDLVHMQDDFNKIATSAKVIKKCHRKIGFQITDMLKKEIQRELNRGDISLDEAKEPIDVYLKVDDKTKMTLYPITSCHEFGEIDRSLTHNVFQYI